MNKTLSKEDAPDGMKWQQVCHDDSCPPYDSYCFYCSRSLGCDSEDKRLVKLSEPDSIHIDQIKAQEELGEKLKQEAIGFAEWLVRKNHIRIDDQWYQSLSTNVTELYNLYKQSKLLNR